MRFNEMKPAPGAKRAAKRVGRGMGSGSGKTCGRGMKGQKSRTGVSIKPGFEGGQMPLQRRLPKFGFTSRIGRFVEQVRLGALAGVDAEVIDLDALKEAGLVGPRTVKAKVIAHGAVEKALKLRGVGVTRGARAAIEAAGGSVED